MVGSPTLDKYMFPLNSPISQGTYKQQVPWQFGMNQKIQTKQIKTSRSNIRKPFQLSSISTGAGAISNGQSADFTTTLTPLAPHTNEINFAIPYVAIYWNLAGVGTAQIWPQIGSGIPSSGTAITVTAGYDLHLFSIGTPGSVIASFSGLIVNNSMGNGTIQLVTQWEFINLNTGSMSAQ